MDHVDWHGPEKYARDAGSGAGAPGRPPAAASSGVRPRWSPPYVPIIRDAGFDGKCAPGEALVCMTCVGPKWVSGSSGGRNGCANACSMGYCGDVFVRLADHQYAIAGTPVIITLCLCARSILAVDKL